MPKANPRKIKSVPSKRWPIIAITTIVIVTVVVWLVALGYVGHSDTVQTTSLELGKGTATATTYELEEARTPEAQTQGLSGRDSMSKDAGMIFVYDTTERRCMWMKDMKFAIDIIWVSEDKRISSIVPDLSPSTYPQSYCAEGKHIIELNAGEAARHGLRVGQILEL